MHLYESKIRTLPRIGQGKVRDIYAVGSDKMLIVTSDRLSAFDVVLSDPIPDKGRVLNEMASFWFDRLRHIVPNQLTGVDPESVVTEEEKPQVRGRSMVVKKLKQGIIIADTKFEFGLTPSNDLVLIDEVLTADSSRFWPADSYRVGMSPPSFDKQYVRDYLETLDWNKTPPAPRLPAEVIARTSEKYREALTRLTGRKLA